MINLGGIWMLLLSVQSLSTYFTGKIAPNEHVVFFPTSASMLNETHWKVPIHGWVYEPKMNSKKRKAFLSLLRRILKIPSDSKEEMILKKRLRAFVVDNSRWKRPTIALGGNEYQLSASGKDGHFQSTLIVPKGDLVGTATDSVGLVESTSTNSGLDGKMVKYHVLSSDNKRHFEGRVQLVPPEGVTVVSDIDDTIKFTDVVRKKEMLQNTFTRDFEPIPCMAEVYQQWSRKLPNSSFHWLSASLYQLYPELEGFRRHYGFPPAAISLKKIRPKDPKQTLETLLQDPFDFKGRSLVQLFETYPQRSFVLVGDTGEKDPQVYAQMAKDYSHQVAKICLRAVSKGPDDNVEERIAEVMEGIDSEKWMVFHEALELLDLPLLSDSTSGNDVL